MTNMQKYILVGALILVSFAVGRYTVHNPEIQTHETVVTNDETTKVQDSHTTTTTKDITKPDGTKEVDTVTTTDVTSKTDTVDISTKQLTQTVTPAKASTLHIAALAGIDTQTLSHPLAYGLSVSKQILGPITIGAFGLSDGTIGLSLGLDF